MLIMIIVVFFLLVANFSMVVPSTIRVSLNVTTNELANSERYAYISLMPFYQNRNDLGIVRNLSRFFSFDDTPKPPPPPNVKKPTFIRRPWVDKASIAYHAKKQMEQARQRKEELQTLLSSMTGTIPSGTASSEEDLAKIV